MAADTEAAALAGLDSLELQQQTRVSARDRARKIWAFCLPKPGRSWRRFSSSAPVPTPSHTLPASPS